MTLITRINNGLSSYIASDDQLNNKDGCKIGVTFKAFKYHHAIGAVSGFLRDTDLRFDIMNEINKYDSYEALVEGILNDIPKEVQSNESIILLSESIKGTKADYAIHIQNGKIKMAECIQPNFNAIHMDPIIINKALNFYEKGILSKEIESCFNSEFYYKHLDFNLSYSGGYNNERSFLHSLFHVKLFYKYGKLALKELIKDSDDNIVEFLIEMYSFIDSLKSGNTGSEYFGKYYDYNENFLRTIGNCNSIMKLDIESGVSVIFQK